RARCWLDLAGARALARARSLAGWLLARSLLARARALAGSLAARSLARALALARSLAGARARAMLARMLLARARSRARARSLARSLAAARSLLARRARSLVARWLARSLARARWLARSLAGARSLLSFSPVLASPRVHKISTTLERKIVRDVSKNPRTSAKMIVADLASSGVDVSRNTVVRALRRGGLQGHRPRRTSLLKEWHIRARLRFAREHLK
ncbi:hypothetical protein KUCAC02_021306, partial [Chaenocephalus aceratus]